MHRFANCKALDFSENSRSALLSLKPLISGKFLLKLFSYLGWLPQVYDETDKCKKWHPQKLPEVHSIFVASHLLPANISTSDKSCFNVVGQRSNNVDPTLKMKQNLTLYFKRCITLIYNVGARRWYDVKTMLHNVVTKLYQRCFNAALTLLKLDRNQSGYW